MAHGTADKAKVTAVFKKRIEDLEKAAQTQAQQFRYFNTYRKWHTPEELKDANLYDTPGMSSPSWDRNEINKIYSSQVLAGAGKEGGTTTGIWAMKLQCDFLAAEERAWRLRHVNLVRAACHAHGRIYGHGSRGPSIFGVLKKLVEEYIEAGGATEGGGDGSFNGFEGDVDGSSAAGIA